MSDAKNVPMVSAGNQRIYLDAEAAGLLAQAVVALDMPKSNIVCGLVRCLHGFRPKAGEDRLVAQLKRVFGRDQFLAFLGAVRAALPDYAEPLPCPAKPDGEPETWKLPFGVGVLAFYAPTEPNVGALFAKASALKGEHRLARVLVVTTNGNSVSTSARADLEAAKLFVVSLADLPATLKRLARKKA